MRTAAAAAAPPPPPPPGERSARLSPAMDGSPRLSPLHPSISATAGTDSVHRHQSLSAALADLEVAANEPETHQSLDYDTVHNATFRENEEARDADQTRQCWGYSGATLGRWVLTVLIGAATGLVAFFLGALIENVTLWKINWVEQILNPCAHACDDPPSGCGPGGEAGVLLRPWLAGAAFCGINALLAMCGAVPTVLLAPEAAGSGIPEVMGYLNGVHVQKIMRLRTLVVKVFATFMAVTSGLTVGPEGPLVHAGAIVGSGVTRGFKVWRWGNRRLCSCRCSWLERFHNDTDRRDFISMGAAVGFAAAFGAPIGGVLFALEEAASFWNGKLMWRTLTATTTACTVMALSRRYMDEPLFGEHKQCAFNDVQVCVTDTLTYNDTICTSPGQENGAEFSYRSGILSFDDDINKTFSHAWEMFSVPVVIGIIGGLMGALFNHFHAKIGAFRKLHCGGPSKGRKAKRLLDVLMVSLLTSVVMFLLATWLGHCRNLNQSWDTKNISPLAKNCNVSNDDFRLQWGSLQKAPPEPVISCDVSCFRKRFSLDISKKGSGLYALKAHQFVCKDNTEHTGNGCSAENPCEHTSNSPLSCFQGHFSEVGSHVVS